MPKETKKKVAAPAAASKAAPAAAPTTPRFYPGDDIVAPKVKQVNGAPKLRSSIKAGTVLILLSGHFRGKRCVFLKQLPSGLLLVTGPYSVNGVPLKRVNQAYVIATSTTVELPKLDLAAFTDEYFAKPKTETKTKDAEGKFFEAAKTKTETSEARKADQAKVDGALIKAVEKTDMLKAYLQAKFSLKKGDKPHEMKF